MIRFSFVEPIYANIVLVTEFVEIVAPTPAVAPPASEPAIPLKLTVSSALTANLSPSISPNTYAVIVLLTTLVSTTPAIPAVPAPAPEIAYTS